MRPRASTSMFVGLYSCGVRAQTVTSRPSGNSNASVSPAARTTEQIDNTAAHSTWQRMATLYLMRRKWRKPRRCIQMKVMASFVHLNVDVDLSRIVENVRAIQQKVAVHVLPVIKADAYGLGAWQVAS